MDQNNPTQVSINVYMTTSESDSSMGVHAAELELSLTPQSGGWVELNLTKGVKSMWPPNTNETEVKITVLTSSNCQKKAPVYFEDPTSISLSQTKRRQRLYALQPLFLVYISDEVLKELVKNESMTHTDDYNDGDDITVESDSATAGRRKRQAPTEEECQVEDFRVTFSDLNLDYIIAPSSYNAKQCKGSCSHQILNEHKQLGNNHAKIMASASLLEHIQPGSFIKKPKAPSCVPTKYGSLTVISPGQDMSLKYVVYSHMIVEECQCR